MYIVLSRVCSLASGTSALSRAPGAWVPTPGELDFAELEVMRSDLAASHPTSIVGRDVCVMAAAWPDEQLERRGAIGWRAVVSSLRGRAPQQQVQVFGEWFALSDERYVRPIVQF